MSTAESTQPNTEVKIYDIMACNVYWDFDNTPLNKEQHKFVVSLYPTPGTPTPDLIDTITAYGPNGYELGITNQQQNNVNRDGWIYDPTLDYYWYMVNTNNGFMEPGEYTIEIKCKDGLTTSMSRVQDNDVSKQVLDAYIENRDAVYNSYSPTNDKPLEEGASLENIPASWKSLKDVADIDAYNVFRIGEASNSMEFNAQNLTWWDNIFMQAVANADPLAGQNRNSVTIATKLKPQASYGYFIETIDSNVQGKTNICILQPHHFFVTP